MERRRFDLQPSIAFADDKFDGNVAWNVFKIDHQVVEVWISHVAMKVSLDELGTTFVSKIHKSACLLLAALTPHLNVVDAQSSRRDDPHGNTVLPRQQELGPTADEDCAFMLCREQDEPSQAAYVLCLGDQLLIEPLSEHFVKPRDRSLIDEIKGDARQMIVLGQLVEHFAIK
jgi:hypothetical protein